MASYAPLPIAVEEGFPQSFRLAVGDTTYTVALYVNVTEEAERPPDHVYDLTEQGAFMVMRVAREAPAAPEVIFQRRLVTGLEYQAHELLLRFDELRVDRRNLNGIGAYGSSVKGGVALRWAS